MRAFSAVALSALGGGTFPDLSSTCFLVDAGHRAVIFDRFRGVQDIVVGEGTHFLIPWVQKPIIFDCRSRPRNVPVITGSKGELSPAPFCWLQGPNRVGLDIVGT